MDEKTRKQLDHLVMMACGYSIEDMPEDTTLKEALFDEQDIENFMMYCRWRYGFYPDIDRNMTIGKLADELQDKKERQLREKVDDFVLKACGKSCKDFPDEATLKEAGFSDDIHDLIRHFIVQFNKAPDLLETTTFKDLGHLLNNWACANKPLN